jgi:hypothetical protein
MHLKEKIRIDGEGSGVKQCMKSQALPLLGLEKRVVRGKGRIGLGLGGA